MAESLGKIVVTSADEPERVFEITGPIVRVGRAPEPQNDLVLNHSWVSRAHLRIYCDRLLYRVQDMRSSNGTALNDLPLPADEIRAMKDGDVISIGPFRLKLVITAEIPIPEGPVVPEVTISPEEQRLLEVERAMAALNLQQALQTPISPPPVAPQAPTATSQPFERWVGIPERFSRWLQYLPPLYAEEEFLGRFLLIFEDMLGPVEQIINHFDLFLDPRTSPETFLPWIDHWMAEIMDERWSVEVKRDLLHNASWLYQMRGTRSALEYELKVCTGCAVEIKENVDGAHRFTVLLYQTDKPVDLRLVERIIQLNRPSHTGYAVQVLS
ncbi:MAG: FHA domain-containing protein [Anaerolineae bacterium]